MDVMIAGIKGLNMCEGKKVVFWDWVGTLVSSDFFFGYHAKAPCGNLMLLEQANKYARVENSVSYIPFAWTLVEDFHKMGMKQVIVSNGSLAEVSAQLECAPFKQFDFVLTACAYTPKPNTHMFDHALAQLKVEKSEAIFIADSPVDEVAAHAADIDFYKVDAHITSYYKIAQVFGFVKQGA